MHHSAIDEAHGFLKSGYGIFTLSFRDFLAEQKKNWERTAKNISEIGPEQKMEIDEKWHFTRRYFQHAEVETDLSFEENATRIIGKKLPHDADFIEPLEEVTRDILAA